MQRTVDWYLDKAKKAAGLSSDRQLSRALGLGANTITQYRTRRVWPAPSTMNRLAILSQTDPLIALADLNVWKEDDPATRKLFETILAKVGGIAATLALFAMCYQALEQAQNISTVAMSGCIL